MKQQHHAMAALLSLGLLLSGCAHTVRHVPVPTSVAVATATRQNIATYLSLDGQVAPLEDALLAFQQSGPVTNVYVNQGDRVVAGELLATIDASTLRAQLSQTEAQAQQSRAQARSALMNVPITHQQTTQAAVSAKAALENARLAYYQDSQLFKQGYVSQSQLEQSRAQYVSAQSQYNTAVANERTTAVQGADAAAAADAARAAQAQTNLLRTEIAQTALYAPFTGVITERLLDPGAMASPGTPALRLSKVDVVWIDVNVPDIDLAYVHPGTAVLLTVPQMGDRRFRGTVGTVNAVPTHGTLSYQARVRLSNPGSALHGGMLVVATIEKAMHRNVVVVPRAALGQTEMGDNVLIVGRNNTVHVVPVRVGLQTSTLAEVSSPSLRAGTRVVTTRADALHDGAQIAISGEAL